VSVVAAIVIGGLLLAAARAALRAAPLGAGEPSPFERATARRDDPAGRPPGLARLDGQVRDHLAGRPVDAEVAALIDRALEDVS
jgi:hypothetical protein